MEKKDFTFIRREKRETDSGTDLYNVFLSTEGKQVSVKSNRVCKRFGDFEEAKKYSLFLQFGSCLGIQYEDTLVFNWAGRVIMKRDGQYYELNPTDSKKPLTTSQAELYTNRFLENNGVSL